jgi:hypothetical protein
MIHEAIQRRLVGVREAVGVVRPGSVGGGDVGVGG